MKGTITASGRLSRSTSQSQLVSSQGLMATHSTPTAQNSNNTLSNFSLQQNSLNLQQQQLPPLVSKETLKSIRDRISGEEKCDPDVEDLLMELISEFVKESVQAGCKLTKHRRGNMLELRDVQLFLGKLLKSFMLLLILLENKYNLSLPGYSTQSKESLLKQQKSSQKSLNLIAHSSRMQHVKEAKLKGKSKIQKRK